MLKFIRLRWRTTFALCNASGAAVAAQSNEVVASSAYTHPQSLIAIEGRRRLNVFCLGSGSPTVLLDAGAGENMMVWRHVQRQIASVTRACAYDRAGYGFSDAAPRTSDARNAVNDLHRLIRAAGWGAVVYVGHSIAGLYAALLVANHPGDVAGLVLVDPGFPHQFEQTSASFTTAERALSLKMFSGGLAQIRHCLALARAGALTRPATKDASSCVATNAYAEPLNDTLRLELERQYAQPKLYGAALSEYSSLWPTGGSWESVDDRELDSIRVDFAERPLIVLTRGNPQPTRGVDPAHAARADSAWVRGGTALAHASTRGTQIVVPKSDHHIQFDQPIAVIDAVRRIVAEIRRP